MTSASLDIVVSGVHMLQKPAAATLKTHKELGWVV